MRRDRSQASGRWQPVVVARLLLGPSARNRSRAAHRGFHIAYISASATLKPGKQWEAWYAFLTEKHGLSKKPAFVGMSRGGEYAYTWATTQSDKVACIYADNPAISPEVLEKLGDLAAEDVPLLHVCGSIDPLLGRSSTVIENLYQQFGGRISVMSKKGTAIIRTACAIPSQSPTSLREVSAGDESDRPPYLGGRVPKTSFYSLETSYQYFPCGRRYITCRGPFFAECYDRYSSPSAVLKGRSTLSSQERRAGQAVGFPRRLRRSRRGRRSGAAGQGFSYRDRAGAVQRRSALAARIGTRSTNTSSITAFPSSRCWRGPAARRAKRMPGRSRTQIKSPAFTPRIRCCIAP